MVEAEQRDAHLEAAEELLREAMTVDKDNRRILILLATVILDRGGDLEQAQWLLKQTSRQGGGRRRRREDPNAVIQRARLLVRQQAFDEAERLLQRVLKNDASHHAAHAVHGELQMAKGQFLLAHQAYKTARERCPVYAPEASLYDASLASLQAHIEAGHAVVQVSASQSESNIPQAQAGTREGSTIRRRRDGSEEEGAEATEASADGAELAADGGEAASSPAEAAVDSAGEEAAQASADESGPAAASEATTEPSDVPAEPVATEPAGSDAASDTTNADPAEEAPTTEATPVRDETVSASSDG